MGFTAVAVEELPVSKQREAAARMKDEAERLAARLPDGAHIVLLDARGKGMTSEDFAEMLGALRDVGTKDLAFVIGGPDGLAPLPGKKAGRSLAFGPQTWPHLLARALLTEQVYRALTILAGPPLPPGLITGLLGLYAINPSLTMIGDAALSQWDSTPWKSKVPAGSRHRRRQAQGAAPLRRAAFPSLKRRKTMPRSLPDPVRSRRWIPS